MSARPPSLKKLLTEEEILLQIEALEQRKALLLKLDSLRHEVAILEGSELTATRAILKTIAVEVCADFKADFLVLQSKSRTDEICIARHAIFYFARKLNRGLTLCLIGKVFYRDHGAVASGCQSFADRISTDPVFAKRMEILEARIQIKIKELLNES